MRLLYLVLLSGLAAPAFGQVEFTLLGRLPGGANSANVNDISADGRVVAGSSGSSLAFWGESTVWTQEEGLQGLGLIGGMASNYASRVSPDGRWVVGHAAQSGLTDAYLWSEATGAHMLGDLGGDRLQSHAFGVSRHGRVVVGQASSPSGPQAFRWTPEGGMVGLGYLGEDDIFSSARAVSADGTRIAGVGNSGVFLYTEQGGMVGLPEIPGGFESSDTFAISDNGRWIAGEGSAEYSDGTRAREAVLWDEHGELVRLGQLDDNNISRYSVAHDVTNDGRVAVGIASGDETLYEGWGQAMIWTPEWGMRNLEEVLLHEYGVNIQEMGWRLDSALGITPDGQYIVGNAFTDLGGSSHQEGYLLRLPIPAPTTLAPLAAFGLLSSRRRR
ncbi:MAG: hypothetical protein ACF8R9_15825 [Phycisphaerales bacterium JB054]